MLRLIRGDVTLVRMFPTFDLIWTLGVETCAAETELVLVVLHMVNS
jgi:hypothetical protein